MVLDHFAELRHPAEPGQALEVLVVAVVLVRVGFARPCFRLEFYQRVLDD